MGAAVGPLLAQFRASALLDALGAADPRKLQLLGCAGCRRVLEALQAARKPSRDQRMPTPAKVMPLRRCGPTNTEELLRAINVAERFADNESVLPPEEFHPDEPPHRVPLDRQLLTHDASRAARSGYVDAALIREIFGDLSHPVAFDREWRTSTALALAQQMYESRDFSAMPILADALQDAGCDCDDVLNHCRQPGEHFLGCWVIDLVLDKQLSKAAGSRQRCDQLAHMTRHHLPRRPVSRAGG